MKLLIFGLIVQKSVY